MTKTVIGIFDDAKAAQNAYERLTAYGFTNQEIDLTDNTSLDRMDSSTDGADRSNDDFGDKVGRFFRNLFDDDNESERYSSAARSRTMVSVYADTMDRAERAAEVLDEAGAIDVNESVGGSEYSSGAYATGTNTLNQEENVSNRFNADQSSSRLNADDSSSNRSIPVIEEELQVGKREVETGGMRVRSRIIDRPVEESLRLRHERVTVERNPVNRPATESDLETFREGEIEVRERAEVPVVNKQARVVEEINVRKDVEEHEEVVRDTVRKTDVEIDKIEGTTSEDGLASKSRSRKKL
jgi:uncharacterized protein (TIGR02271 family)